MNKLKKKVSLIVPCYNEEKNIQLFYNESKKYLDNKDFDLEIIFVNDGSRDDTETEINKLINIKDNTINIIDVNFSRNFGKESAIYAGLVECSGDYIAIIDADLQQNPKFIMDMYNELESNKSIDCVCFYQEHRKEGKITSFLKKMFYKVFSKITSLDIHNGASDFRMFRNYVKESILNMKEFTRFSKGIFSWVGYNTKYIAYTPDKRVNGKSSFNTRKLFKYAISGIESFSTKPLKIVKLFSFTFVLSSLFLLIYGIIKSNIFNSDFSNVLLIIIVNLFIAGIVLLCLSIMCDYLSIMFYEIKGRPIYIAKSIKKNNK